MHTANVKETECPVLIIAYDDKVRAVLAKSMATFACRIESCANFRDAEKIALREPCLGILVDLGAMIKAKSEEKIVAYTLASCFPTLRVRAMGPMIVPMMSGDAKQDKSLSEFISKTCADFTPRRLRAHKRMDISLPTFIGDQRGFTLNISWSGAFIVDMNPERFSLGDRLTVSFPDFGLGVEMVVARIQQWGDHRQPGVGVEFADMSQDFETSLRALLRSNKDSDHDGQIT